jgi:hypothetical protein
MDKIRLTIMGSASASGGMTAVFTFDLDVSLILTSGTLSLVTRGFLVALTGEDGVAY